MDPEIHKGRMLLSFPLSFHCSRGFAIPELLIADFQSARVVDPQLFPPVDLKSTGTHSSEDSEYSENNKQVVIKNQPHPIGCG